MIYMTSGSYSVRFIVPSLLLLLRNGAVSQSTGSSTGYTSTTDATTGTGATSTDYSTTDIGSTTGFSTTPDPSTTPYEDYVTAEEETGNVTWLVIGIVVGIIIVLIAVIGAAIAYAVHRNKKIHPHSDTESFYSEESETQTRPTTASHIYIDPEEEAMSQPVAMTPFELRKLYIETFPYSKWKRGFDGSLRPHMGLKFVPPNLYNKTKGDEKHFREKIYNYEHSDSLTLRSSALSRMMRQSSTLPTQRETMSPLPEMDFPPSFIPNGTAPQQTHHNNNNGDITNRRSIREEDVDLF